MIQDKVRALKELYAELDNTLDTMVRNYQEEYGLLECFPTITTRLGGREVIATVTFDWYMGDGQTAENIGWGPDDSITSLSISVEDVVNCQEWIKGLPARHLADNAEYSRRRIEEAYQILREEGVS